MSVGRISRKESREENVGPALEEPGSGRQRTNKNKGHSGGEREHWKERKNMSEGGFNRRFSLKESKGSRLLHRDRIETGLGAPRTWKQVHNSQQEGSNRGR